MSNIPFVDLKAQHASIRGEIDAAVADVLDQCNFILGDPVSQFEAAFAAFIGTKNAFGVSDGLDALTVALRVIGIAPGDEVIIPANTFIATALAATQAGATVRLVDCHPETWEMDPSRLEEAITPKTKVIMPVHLYGMSAEMDPILSIAGKRGITVIEDAAQAHGVRFKGKGCGSLGALGCFSFYPGKNLGACGDGGAVTTNDPILAERIKLLRNYGQRVKYEHIEKGVNSRLDTLQAGILTIKLKRLQSWNEARARHARAYIERLGGVGDLRFQKVDPNSTHIYHLFVLETGRRDALQAHLRAAGVDTGIHYPHPVHRQKAYLAELGQYEGHMPVAERLAGRILSLPMFAELNEKQIDRVCSAIKSFF